MTTYINYCQIFRTPFGVTETSKNTKTFIRENDLDYQRRKKGTEHMVDIERAFLFGKKHKDTSGAHSRAAHRERTTNDTNMQLTDQQIDEFMMLYERRFGVVLTREQALGKGLGLCRFVELVAREQIPSKEAIVNGLGYSVGPSPQAVKQTRNT